MLTIKTDKPYHIFAEALEQEALDQFESAMQQDFVVHGALMPDAHAGYSLPIGGVVATRGMIVPAWVGYDIGCGMCAVKTSYKKESIIEHSDEIFDAIYAAVPVGFKHNEKDTEWNDVRQFIISDAAKEIFDRNGLKQLGSLGGGNHFIEIGYGSDDGVWIIVHSGSRGIGHAIASYYMKLASGDGKAREGHFGLREDRDDGIEYEADLNFCLHFALENRVEIIRRVNNVIHRFCDGSVYFGSIINRNHNHAEYKDGLWIHRKGATHAEAGMLGVIPGNMRDGSFIVSGLGNPDSLWSSSHGAGRVLGRKAAQKALNIEDFYFTMMLAEVKALVTQDTLDESPFAYKDIFEVMRMQAGLVEVVDHVRPLVNIKAGEKMR